MVYRRLKTDSASLLPWSPASSGAGGWSELFAPAKWAVRPDCKKCILRMLFKKKNLLYCRTAAAEPMGAFWLRRVRDSARIGKRIGSPRVGNRGQMGFRGRRKAAGASSRRPASRERPATRNAQAAAARAESGFLLAGPGGNVQ